ncbi:MAG TPA: hypothetical protein VJC14_02275 [Candidatus Paceibacterota bacterium]
MQYWIVVDRENFGIQEKLKKLPEGTTRKEAEDLLATFPDDARLLQEVGDPDPRMEISNFLTENRRYGVPATTPKTLTFNMGEIQSGHIVDTRAERRGEK